VHAHFFVIGKGLVDSCNVDNEYNENNGDKNKSYVEQDKLLVRNTELPSAVRIFRNNLDSVKFTTHDFTVSGFP